jgi:hypothetical protein
LQTLKFAELQLFGIFNITLFKYKFKCNKNYFHLLFAPEII